MDEQFPPEERNTDCWPITDEPRWQVEVGDRTVLDAQRLGNNGQRQRNPVAAKTRLSEAITAAAIAARRPGRFASSTYGPARVDRLRHGRARLLHRC